MLRVSCDLCGERVVEDPQYAGLLFLNDIDHLAVGNGEPQDMFQVPHAQFVGVCIELELAVDGDVDLRVGVAVAQMKVEVISAIIDKMMGHDFKALFIGIEQILNRGTRNGNDFQQVTRHIEDINAVQKMMQHIEFLLDHPQAALGVSKPQLSWISGFKIQSLETTAKSANKIEFAIELVNHHPVFRSVEEVTENELIRDIKTKGKPTSRNKCLLTKDKVVIKADELSLFVVQDEYTLVIDHGVADLGIFPWTHAPGNVSVGDSLRIDFEQSLLEPIQDIKVVLVFNQIMGKLDFCW